MEETVSGFKVKGDWSDVVEHGERITAALESAGCEGDAYDEWNEWRPKAPERIDEDIREKTAEQAHVGEGPGERADQTPGDDVLNAGEELTRAYDELDEADSKEALDCWRGSVGYLVRAADSASRKVVRSVEDVVYKRMMTLVAPFYFDNELVSANLQRTGRPGAERRFTFEVNVNDDDLKASVSESLASYEERVDRWHIEAETETENVEAVEGVEPPEQEARGPKNPGC
jgi:hypothetical protein